MNNHEIIILFFLLILLLSGCENNKPQPLDNVKLGDLVPTVPDSTMQPLISIWLDIEILEIPTEKIDSLNDLWYKLLGQKISVTKYTSFTNNNFRARFGRGQTTLEDIYKELEKLQAIKVSAVSMLYEDGQVNDLPITDIPETRNISHISSDGLRKSVYISSGIIALRTKASLIPNKRGTCEVKCYPTFTIPLTSPIDEFNDIAKSEEQIFDGAVFGLEMTAGDFVVLGPNSPVMNQKELGGLFFLNPNGNFFRADPSQPLIRKPSAKILIIKCSGVVE